MMKREPGSAPNKAAKKQRHREIIQRVWKQITHQWGWKLTSLVLALCLWGGLVSQDNTLLRDKVFTDVKVTVANATVLQQNGYIVVSGLENIEPVKIKVQVPQRNYSSATADRYTVRANLSQINAAGEQKIKLTASSTNAALYGNVTEISTQYITVQVEEYTTRTRIPVQINTVGAVPAGFYADPPSCDPTTVNIGGPRSVVDSIARCVAQYDASLLSAMSGTARTTVSYTFEDRMGNPVDGSNLTVTSQSVALRDIIVDQTLYPTMEVAINQKDLVVGSPAEGYEITGVTVEPEYVTIAATDLSDFEDGNKLLYLVSQVRLNGESQDVTKLITISSPGSIVNMSDNQAYVTVSIAPIAEDGERE